MNVRDAATRYPGRVVASPSRAADPDVAVVVCRERLLRPGLRPPGVEAVLDDLRERSADLASLVDGVGLGARTFLVEVFESDPAVAAKVGFAAKAALVERGVAVSDRTPVLGVDDLEVLTRLPPLAAYPAACTRWTDTGGLGPGDALVAVVRLDPRETVLHAGVCADGGWAWLR
jgi:hypothetical protein